MIPEPLGGAHRDPEAMAATLKKVLLDTLRELEIIPSSELQERRYQRLRGYGAFSEG